VAGAGDAADHLPVQLMTALSLPSRPLGGASTTSPMAASGRPIGRPRRHRPLQAPELPDETRRWISYKLSTRFGAAIQERVHEPRWT